MTESFEAELKSILQTALQRAAEIPLAQEYYQRWTRTENGWNSAYELRAAYPITHNVEDKNSQQLKVLLEKHFPDHLGMVGTELGSLRLSADQLLRHLVWHYWSQNQTFEIVESVLSCTANDLSTFLCAKEIEVEFSVPLLNFDFAGKPCQINLADDLLIRQLHPDEFSDLHGGTVNQQLSNPRNPLRMPEYIVTGKLVLAKIVGDRSPDAEFVDPLEPLIFKLRRIVLALRTFKSGFVGYQDIKLAAKSVCPIPLGNRSQWNEVVPMGRYALTEEEAQEFATHYERIRLPLHSSLEIAATRLTEAEGRTAESDRLIDSVIGLEAILLHKKSQELRHRFALNYACLFNGLDARLKAYDTAKQVYDARSTVAHGGDEKFFKIDGSKKTVREVADLARDMLRHVLKRFLSPRDNPAFLSEDYWNRAVLGGAPI